MHYKLAENNTVVPGASSTSSPEGFVLPHAAVDTRGRMEVEGVSVCVSVCVREIEISSLIVSLLLYLSEPLARGELVWLVNGAVAIRMMKRSNKGDLSLAIETPRTERGTEREAQRR